MPDARIKAAVGYVPVGNSVEAPIAVASVFNDTSKVTAIWKWVTAGATAAVAYPNWAFYTPTQSDGGQAYAASKGYDFLTTINAGEGFWVNAKTAFTTSLPAAAAVQSSSFKPAVGATAGGTHALAQRWNLIATGDSPTPSQFDSAIATTLSTPPGPGQVYAHLTTLWAWDTTQQRWYLWAPRLVNSGGLTNYIENNDFLDFATLASTPSGTLSPTMGLWVNMP